MLVAKMFTKSTFVQLSGLILFMLANELCSEAAQISLNVQHDMSKPTYGLHGQSSSQVNYDEKNGLNLRGTINDMLGPPIKIANGFSNLFHGSNMAGVGNSLRGGGALLGFDARLLEAAGAGNLLKGGLLLSGANAKSNLAGQLAGREGQKIANIIEIPVKVVAMKDVATGKALSGLGRLKEQEAQATKTRGDALVKEGDHLKQQGMNQVMQGAAEGVQNIGNFMQQTAGNAATAFKLLPIMLDLPTVGGQQQQQQQQQQLQEDKSTQRSEGPLTGGSPFGGLTSLLPGLGGASGVQGSPFNLFGMGSGGGHATNGAYAALMNSTSPIMNLLMNPNTNPLLYPLAQGPLGQSIGLKQPIGTAGSSQSLLGGGQTSTSNFNLFPGIKLSETVSSRYPGQQQQIQQQKD